MKQIYKRLSESDLDDTYLLQYKGVKADAKLLESIALSGITQRTNLKLGSMVLHHSLWDEAMELVRLHDTLPDRVSFRIAWGLEAAYMVDSRGLEERSEQLFDDFASLTQSSPNRLYAKMICDLIRRKKLVLNDKQAQRAAEKCFALLIDPQTNISLKAWMIELLDDLSDRVDYVGENLSPVVEQLSTDYNCSAGMASVCRRYLKRVSRKGFC